MNSVFGSLWEQWIGVEAAEMQKKFGFYSTFNPSYNLRIFALNTQACNSENWYLLRNPTDPYD